MNERVMEILNLLIRLMLREEGPPRDEVGIIQDLLKKGYTPTEIETAFGVIFSLPGDVKEGRETLVEGAEPPEPHRVLNYAERLKLSVEAQGFLTSLVAIGLLERGELEEALLYLGQLDVFEMGVGEVSWLLERVVRDENRLALITGAGLARELRGRSRMLH